MAVALEGADLVAIAGLLVVIGLLIATKHLLQPIAGALEGWTLDLVVWSGHPLAWLGRDIDKWVVAGIDDAIAALGSVVADLWHGLVWSFDEMLSIFSDLATKARNAIQYLWTSVLVPYVAAAIKPVRALATAAVNDAAAIARKEAADIARTAANAEAFAWRRLADAEGFTKTEVTAARRDLSRAINDVSSYVHTAEAGAIAIPGQIPADFEDLWKGLRDYIRPDNLEKLLGAGLLSGMLLRVIAQNAGLDSSECQAKHKGICGVDLKQWLGMLEGLALMDGTLDLATLLKLCRVVFDDAKGFIEQAA